MLTRRTPHIHSAYFILGWVVHILDGGIEDIGFGVTLFSKIKPPVPEDTYPNLFSFSES